MARSSEELSTTLKLSREKMGSSLTLVYLNGTRHVIHPTKAFQGDWRALAEAVSQGQPYRIERTKQETHEPKQ